MAGPFNPRDRFFRKARREGYRARSAYKLKEILERHRLLRRKGAVLDLGAAPGGFLQVLAEVVGEEGTVVGVDLTAIAPVGSPAVTTIVGDVMDPGLEERLREVHDGRFDLLVSDMAPKTTGNHATDVARSHALVRRCLEVGQQVLRPGGHVVVKVFMGEGFDELLAEVKAGFRRVKVERPEAVRSRSRECYLVAQGLGRG